MANCPLNRSNPPCDMEMDLLILQEAERESMEVFSPCDRNSNFI